MSQVNWAETCSVCNNSTRWWHSKFRDYLVCAICNPDVLKALEVLARYGKPGLVKQVQSWRLQDADISQSSSQP